jgi:hypothetical protein
MIPPLDSGDEDAWFVPKRYGYGAGPPIAWQGWVVLGAYIAIVLLLAFLVSTLAGQHSPLAVVPGAGILLATVWLMWICARHTRGGWRWRWGSDD